MLLEWVYIEVKQLRLGRILVVQCSILYHWFIRQREARPCGLLKTTSLAETVLVM